MSDLDDANIPGNSKVGPGFVPQKQKNTDRDAWDENEDADQPGQV